MSAKSKRATRKARQRSQRPQPNPRVQTAQAAVVEEPVAPIKSSAPRERPLRDARGWLAAARTDTLRERVVKGVALLLVIFSLVVLLSTSGGQVTLSHPVWPAQPSKVQTVTSTRCAQPSAGETCWRAQAISPSAMTGHKVTGQGVMPPVGSTIRTARTPSGWVYVGRGTGSTVSNLLLSGIALALILFGLAAGRVLLAGVLVATLAVFFSAPALLGGGAPVLTVAATTVLLTLVIAALSARRLSGPVLARTLIAVTPGGLLAATVPSIVRQIDPPNLTQADAISKGVPAGPAVLLLTCVLLTAGLFAVLVPRWLAHTQGDTQRGTLPPDWWRPGRFLSLCVGAVKTGLGDARQLANTSRSELTLITITWLALSVPALLTVSAHDADTPTAVASGPVVASAVPFGVLLIAGSLIVMSVVALRHALPISSESEEAES